MSRAPSGLGWPPDDHGPLASLPPARQVPSVLHRLSDHLAPWWFASVDDPADGTRGGRFDLTAPGGTCYLAERLEGALLEKLWRRPKRAVPAQRLDRLFHARIAVQQLPRAADLTSPRVSGLTLNAELHSSLDYHRTRAWARALHDAGWRGLRYLLRADVAARERGLALFGRSGLHSRAPAGMRTSVDRLDRQAATRILARRGIRILPVPVMADLPVVDPP